MQGTPVVSVRVSVVGDSGMGARLVEPLRRAAPLVMDTVADIDCADFASITADPTTPAAAIEHFGLLREFTEDTVDAVAAAGPDGHTGVNIVDIRHLDGAFSRCSGPAYAIGARDAAYAFFTLTIVPPGQGPAAHRDAGPQFIAALRPWLHGRSHPGFLGPADATESGTRRAYDEDVYLHLRRTKAEFDPDNMFRVNHNIPPLTPNP